MSFFRKLKDRLKTSSSRLSDGVNEILSTGADPSETDSGPESISEHSRPSTGSSDPAGRLISAKDDSSAYKPDGVGADGDDESGDPYEGPSRSPDQDTTLLFGRRTRIATQRRRLDDDMLEELEDLLISADLGIEAAGRIVANLAENYFGRRLGMDEIMGLLAEEVVRILEPVARPMPLFSRRPQVVLVVGVNGSGKTTTIGKLASQFRDAGKSVIIAAGDTFRAAAIEQLQIWADRAGVPIFVADRGSDPASVAFDAMAEAETSNVDILIVDTAGRLQNRDDLMAELAKVVRVIRKRDSEAPHNTLLVLDATTGQNAISQAEVFVKVADVTGLVMTKLDGTAKGGVLVAIADRFGLPIHAIGVGEGIEDLQPFEADEFARALTGYGG